MMEYLSFTNVSPEFEYILFLSNINEVMSPGWIYDSCLMVQFFMFELFSANVLRNLFADGRRAKNMSLLVIISVYYIP